MFRWPAGLAAAALLASGCTPAGTREWLGEEVPAGSLVLAEGPAARLLPPSVELRLFESLADVGDEDLARADFLLLDSRAWRQRFHPRRTARRMARYRRLVRDPGFAAAGLRTAPGTRLLLLERMRDPILVAETEEIEMRCAGGLWSGVYAEPRPFGLARIRCDPPPSGALAVDGQPVAWAAPGASVPLELWQGDHRIEVASESPPRLRVERVLHRASLVDNALVDGRVSILLGMD